MRLNMSNTDKNLHRGILRQDGWSTIEETPIYVEKLLLLCHSMKELQRHGYVTTALSDEKLNEKRRCQNCGCWSLTSLWALIITQGTSPLEQETEEKSPLQTATTVRTEYRQISDTRDQFWRRRGGEP